MKKKVLFPAAFRYHRGYQHGNIVFRSEYQVDLHSGSHLRFGTCLGDLPPQCQTIPATSSAASDSCD